MSTTIRQQLGLDKVNDNTVAPIYEFNRYAANADPTLVPVAAQVIADITAEVAAGTPIADNSGQY
jgi:hypothetical protein